ncbi:palmitoyltransferase ZDHHC23-like [Mizuhopecten yessoensis]|uniref:Palmitoyltransferase n=1 Tax=Mizuhopecten yessoensis TaxID=6573 RepID=A0A210Q7R8_MIZYE|nr:palmitoyltransferase ZDHHC23-like [Mizuhopecten yessoensis]OWF44792.1 palmitoyltransferase ZDHHC23 [Mizuhopecten yessoensis]
MLRSVSSRILGDTGHLKGYGKVMPSSRSRVTSTEPLCCCEYENIKGEKSHILACCCDCDAVDEACDRCITCQRVPPRMQAKILKTINDRCRIPGIFGHGATQLRLDIIVPLFIVPLSVLVATMGPIMTVLSLTFMPLFMLFFYRTWRRNTEKTRTPFFFVWGLVSVILMFVTFQSFIVAFREILLWENILLTTAFFGMLYYMSQAKYNSRSLRPHTTYQRLRREDVYNSNRLHENHSSATQENSKDYTQVTIDKNVGSRGMSLDEITTASLPEEQVTWIDSRPIKDGKLVTWCADCEIKKPSRSGHCTVCKACFAVRDHHCVWIDCCITAHNHRQFMAAMMLFVFCGFYGVHLTLTTVCTPQLYYGWFLLPNDCRFLYIDFQTAVSFVSGLYCLLAAGLMSCNLLYQIILISQNVTSQEIHMANKRKLTKCYGLKATANLHDRGIFKNILLFLTSKRNSIGLIKI